MTTATLTKCACESCQCAVDEDSTLKKDGKYFCSEACANGHPDGAGCGHPGCGCHQ